MNHVAPQVFAPIKKYELPWQMEKVYSNKKV